MNTLIEVVRIVFTTLFPTHPRDAWLDVVDPDTLARLAHPPITRFGTTMIAPLPYHNTLIKRAIHAAKYHGHIRATQVVGRAIAPTLLEELADKRMVGSFERPIMVPIPLHPMREEERGYNQSERITQAILQVLQDPTIRLHTHALVRIKHTSRQARTKNKQERLSNIEGAFQAPDYTTVQNRDIILVDDVITTGATMYAARTALLDAGAREVLCVAVAH
jgi:ComF family protein